MDVSYIDFNENYVAINVDIYKTKEINLQISTGNPAEGYVMTGIEYEPKRIVVAGKEEDIRRIRYLPVKYNISNATEDISEEIDLQEELPEGIIIVGEDKTAVINIKIEKMNTKDITIWPGDIDFKNKSTSYSLYINTTGPMQVTVMGPEKELNDITRATLKPFIDLADFKNGSYTEHINFDDLMVHSQVTISPEVSFDLALLD
jgi:YbbR domain-containing protein